MCTLLHQAMVKVNIMNTTTTVDGMIFDQMMVSLNMDIVQVVKGINVWGRT